MRARVRVSVRARVLVHHSVLLERDYDLIADFGVDFVLNLFQDLGGIHGHHLGAPSEVETRQDKSSETVLESMVISSLGRKQVQYALV